MLINGNVFPFTTLLVLKDDTKLLPTFRVEPKSKCKKR